MSQYIYWPYDEVNFVVNHAENKVGVQSPWLQLKAGLQEGEGEAYALLGSKISTQTLTGEDVPWVHSLINRFEGFPLCYTLPTAKPNASDTHTLNEAINPSPTVREVVAQSLRGEATTTPVDDTLRYLSRQNFEWDVEAALQFAGTPEGIHPESLFSVARRFHLLDVLENDKGKEVFAHIEALAPAERAKAVAKLVRQNHFVTQRCREALFPALERAQSARQEVESFMRAESGHDRILGAALKEFTENPETIEVAPSTVCLMNLLKLAAETNFLAFAIAVDCFERSSYEDSDPLAQLLIKAGFENAAKQINRHKAINDHGEHENVARHFLEPMQPCTPEYATQALRLAETISLVMNSITQASLP